MCFLSRTRTKGNEIKEVINMLRHIFSFKLVIVFALVAFLGALPKVPDALALVTCPCPFSLMYKASIAQAKGVGETNKVDVCFEDSGFLSVEGGVIQSGSCFPGMGIFDLTSSNPVCDYLSLCQTSPGYATEPINDNPELTELEVKACR